MFNRLAFHFKVIVVKRVRIVAHGETHAGGGRMGNRAPTAIAQGSQWWNVGVMDRWGSTGHPAGVKTFVSFASFCLNASVFVRVRPILNSPFTIQNSRFFLFLHDSGWCIVEVALEDEPFLSL
jgi:hypothetical protein